MVRLLDLDVEAHRTILEQLPVQHLSALSGTCRHFRSCVLEGRFAEKLWRNRCQQQVGEGFLCLHQAGLPHQLAPTARYWRHLWYHADSMDHMRWWKGGSDIINNNAEQADARALEDNDAPGPPMKARLARSGHLSSVIGHLMVVSGGILRDGSLCMDLVIINLSTLNFIKPEVYGVVPMTRFRHTGVVLAPEQSSTVVQTVNQLLHPVKRDASQGSVVLLFGGYNTMGQEFGGHKIEAIWVAHDGSAVAWVSINTQGHAPSKRFHHTTTLFDGGKQVILYGGEGHEMIDGAGGQPPNVYTLDIGSLTWHRRSTSCVGADGSPGVRSLHIVTVRENPETGHEELIVLAGYCSNVLANMNPHRLDLVTWQWFKESGLVPNPGPGDATVLPIPRQRAAGEVVGKKWVLMHAGSPTQFLQGNFLDDVNRLHLPSLTWRQPPTLHGRPARALRNIAGHSLEGLIAFGGCIPTIMGIMPVAKTDPLLIGPPPRLDLLLERGPASPSCHLPPLVPPAPPALDALKVPVSMGHLYPPTDILPHPSGANISHLAQHNPLPEHQSWGPELDPHLYGFESLGGPFSSSGPLRIPQAAPLSAVGLAADQERVVGLAADQERVVGLPADQERVVELAADQERVVGPPADQEHVVESSPHLPAFAQGGASMQPRAAWISRQAAAVRGAALPVDRRNPGQRRKTGSSSAVWSNVPNVVQLPRESHSEVWPAAAVALGQAPHQDQAGSRAGPSLHTVAAAAQTSSALAQISSSTAVQAAPSSQAGASRAGLSFPVTAHAQNSSTPARSSGMLIQNSSSTLGQTAELPSSTHPSDAHFVLWRPPMMWHDHQQGKAPAAAPIYLRDEVTGEFFVRQENEHHEAVMMPAEVASSDSSDSVGSPGGVAAFLPEGDLSQIPPNGPAQNQGPCLMQ